MSYRGEGTLINRTTVVTTTTSTISLLRNGHHAAGTNGIFFNHVRIVDLLQTRNCICP